MLTILIWLGSGFAFSCGIILGAWLQKITAYRWWFRDHCCTLRNLYMQQTAKTLAMSESLSAIAKTLDEMNDSIIDIPRNQASWDERRDVRP
ncbi:MAG: hypothetical protein ABFD89_03730 [Bryobacteraceae bacterium]